MGVCDDLISRRSAIDLIHKTVYGFFDIVDNESEEPMSEKDKLLLEVNKVVSNGIKDLPSAQPERKKGKWVDPAAIDVYRCSVCEEYTKLEVPKLFYHYCPNCGAEMEENDGEIH